MKRHNARVGAVIHAYNAAHASVYMVLSHAAQEDSHEASRELWFSYGSDKAQRDFTVIYCRENAKIKPPIRRAIAWSISALNGLAQHRNDAAHSDMIWHYDRLVPGLIARNQTHTRMEDVSFDRLWRSLQGDFSALSNYLMDLAFDISFENTWPSAQRPKLRLFRSEDTKRQERNRKAKRKARQGSV
jgi:hypothetical protein